MEGTVSRKVFVGGLPCSYPSSHIEDNLFNLFRVFGSLTITWPGKKHFGGGKDIKGYVFLLFEEEASVHRLLSVCKMCERGLYYIEVTFLEGTRNSRGARQNNSSLANHQLAQNPVYHQGPRFDRDFPTGLQQPLLQSPQQKKRLHIQPWFLRDRWVFVDEPSDLLHRRTIFVGGVPRCIKAGELASKLEARFPGVRYVGLDVDREFLFPKGAARATFFSGEAHRAALKARFLSFVYSDHRGQERKKVLEIKPYIVDEMECDACVRVGRAASPAVLFCPHLACLAYLCTACFIRLHPLSDPELASHRPLSKDPKLNIDG
ncbi:cytoplasmic polyadenylation element-binding protein 3-like [Tropilaelaps mercedesae]|uniref:Cytoplasmic polyadenylation element-binding protein 3-like n=1 Tax=Tropilaelaps mercedesae TaxID=418985 RepID=A0A1V9X4X5_9ACAR|nr:cytoplasmic polyadenylation element-binding protein 3-like [Tropilaelaps mercedesae]